MDKKWRKSIFQLLPLDGRYFLTVALKYLQLNIQCSNINSRKSWGVKALPAQPPARSLAMQEIQGNMDDVLSRNDLRDDEKAKRYFQLWNRYLAFKEQWNTRTRPEEIISTVLDLTSRTQDSSTATTAFSTSLNRFNVTPELTQAAISQKTDKESLIPPPP